MSSMKVFRRFRSFKLLSNSKLQTATNLFWYLSSQKIGFSMTFCGTHTRVRKKTPLNYICLYNVLFVFEQDNDQRAEVPISIESQFGIFLLSATYHIIVQKMLVWKFTMPANPFFLFRIVKIVIDIWEIECTRSNRVLKDNCSLWKRKVEIGEKKTNCKVFAKLSCIWWTFSKEKYLL